MPRQPSGTGKPIAMLSKRIIPCLDVANGRVVKGTNFVELKDAGDPIELAAEYDRQGADELVFLDITATSDKRKVLVDFVKKTAEKVFIPFTVGGGIGDLDTINELLLAGADKISINSAAIKDPDLVKRASDAFGSQCIVIAIDAKQINTEDSLPPDTLPAQLSHVSIDTHSTWEIYTHGGRRRTGIDAIKWAHYMEALGAGELLVTSMDKDGTKSGYDIPLTKTIAQNASIPVIASGGAGNIDHIDDVLHHCEAALLASLLHYKELTVEEIKRSCSAHHPIRLVQAV